MHQKKIFLILVIFLYPLISIAQTPGFGKEQRGDQNPFRIFYFSYDITHPGLMMGPEYNFLWEKTDKITCETGVKYIDRNLLFSPQFGFFLNPGTNFNLFVNVEIDYQTIYNNCWLFEMFVAPGYVLKFGDGTDMRNTEIEKLLSETKGAFFPQIGLGTGYDFNKKNLSNCMVKLRVLSASTDVSENFFVPSLQLGFIYNL